MNHRDDSGFSLTELLVVSVMLGFILAGAWSILYATSAMSNSLSARAVATDESQTFLDTIGRELREADSLTALGAATASTPQGAFSEISPRAVTFYVDLYHNGKAQKVRYYISGVSLYRQEWASTNNAYPFAWASTPTKTGVVIKSIDPAWSGPIFTYYTNDNLPPTQITDVANVASVTAVTIEVKNLQEWGNRSASFGASSTVRVRAIGNKF